MDIRHTKRKIDYLVIHTTASSTHETPESMDNYFRKILQWNRDGYHITILRDGTHHRFIDDGDISNGVEPYGNDSIVISNTNSLNVSYIGGLKMDDQDKNVVLDKNKQFIPLDNRTEAQTKALEDIVKYYITILPSIKVLGHNQISPKYKTCPNFYVPNWLKSIGIENKNIYFEDNWGVNKRMGYDKLFY